MRQKLMKWLKAAVILLRRGPIEKDKCCARCKNQLFPSGEREVVKPARKVLDPFWAEQEVLAREMKRSHGVDPDLPCTHYWQHVSHHVPNYRCCAFCGKREYESRCGKIEYISW